LKMGRLCDRVGMRIRVRTARQRERKASYSGEPKN